MTKAEETLEALNNLKYQVELAREYERILAEKYAAVKSEDEQYIKQALEAYLYDLEDLMEENFETIKIYLENDKKGEK